MLLLRGSNSSWLIRPSATSLRSSSIACFSISVAASSSVLSDPSMSCQTAKYSPACAPRRSAEISDHDGPKYAVKLAFLTCFWLLGHRFCTFMTSAAPS